MMFSEKKKIHEFDIWLKGTQKEQPESQWNEDIIECFLSDYLNIPLGTLREMAIEDVFSMQGYKIAKQYIEQEQSGEDMKKDQHNKWRGRKV